ncbi:MAG: prephenate dehydratase [Solirubrobacterales bacterium]|jgi:prephenate dehydratase|nr:prephenate dehydratase [Solirubrobacterales bacterium]
MRVTYLGPEGTFSGDALAAALGGGEAERLPQATIYDAILAVEEGRAERAFVPFENSIEGAVRATLDTLAFEAESVAVVGEHDHPVSHSLVAGRQLELAEITAVLSHPQANAQCSRFIREQLPQAEVRAAASTAEAVRIVGESGEPWAAIGTASAAAIYGGVVLREGIEDSADNVTRFVWIGPGGLALSGGDRWKTSLAFAELGEDHPGALVEALTEFSSRAVNLTRIESRPLRQGLGRYMFFIDLEGSSEQADVAAAIAALREKASSVRILGSYPVDAAGIPGEPA